MLYQILLLALIVIESFSSSVISVVMRETSPSGSDDCMSGASGTYSNGDTFTVTDLSSNVYFCSVYTSASSGEVSYNEVEGSPSGFVSTESGSTLSKDYSRFYNSYSIDLKDFLNDNSLIMRGVITDSSGNELDSMEDTINIIFDVSPSIDTCVIRTSAPLSSDDYLPTGDGVISPNTLGSFNSGDLIYFACRFINVFSGQTVEILGNGMQSGESTSTDKTLTSFDDSYRRYTGTTIDTFKDDTNVEIVANIKDSDGTTILDTYSYNIQIEISGLPDDTSTVPSIVSIVANVRDPDVFEDYLETAEGVVGDSTAVFEEDDNSILYFPCVFSDVSIGYSTLLEVVGQQNQYEISSSIKPISEALSSYARALSLSVNSFIGNSQLEAFCYILDSSDSIIDSKSVLVNIQINEVGSSGYCQEKPGKTKPACANQQTQVSCESYTKCEWVQSS